MTANEPVHHVLVVCAANICRSPAAATLLGLELAARSSGVDVSSAGVTALGGRPACDLALALLGAFEPRTYEPGERVGAGHHSSRRLMPADLVASDGLLVVVMEAWHAAAVRDIRPEARVRLLDPEGDIPDPHAVGYQAHPMVFDRIRRAVVDLAAAL